MRTQHQKALPKNTGKHPTLQTILSFLFKGAISSLKLYEYYCDFFNALSPLPPYKTSWKKDTQTQCKRFRDTLRYAKKKNYIEQSPQNSKVITLTQKGQDLITLENIRSILIAPQKQWDGKWRIVLFDIPNDLSLARDALRRKLKYLKFQQLQKSVFIIPWPCSKEINLIRKRYKIEKYVQILEVTLLEGEVQWKKNFKLKF